MGATFSVALGQAVTIAIVAKEQLPLPKMFSGLKNFNIQSDRNVIILYIDDITIFGTSAGKVNRDRKHGAGVLAKENLQTNAEKDVIADDFDYNVAIGLP